MNRLSKTNILITIFLLLSFAIQVKARYASAQSSQQTNPQMNFQFNSQTYGGQVPQLDDQPRIEERRKLHQEPAVEVEQK